MTNDRPPQGAPPDADGLADLLQFTRVAFGASASAENFDLEGTMSAEGRGGWIEKGSGEAGRGDIQAPMDRWRTPPEWGVGTHLKHLKNLYVYFWRWATLKVFGAGQYAATGLPDRDLGYPAEPLERLRGLLLAYIGRRIAQLALTGNDLPQAEGQP